MSANPEGRLGELVDAFGAAQYNAAVQEHVEGYQVAEPAYNERQELVAFVKTYIHHLHIILEAAYKFDDKPHHLYSAIGAAAALHDQASEIRRLMNEAYDRKGLSPVFRVRDV